MLPEPFSAERITTKVLSWLSKREVKTPLSFFFRIAGYASAIIIVMVIWGSPELQRLSLLVGISVLVGLAILVAFFAWCRPKHLVYGETGHRAERKLALGTETRELTESELSTLPGTAKPKELAAGGSA